MLTEAWREVGSLVQAVIFGTLGDASVSRNDVLKDRVELGFLFSFLDAKTELWNWNAFTIRAFVYKFPKEAYPDTSHQKRHHLIVPETT